MKKKLFTVCALLLCAGMLHAQPVTTTAAVMLSDAAFTFTVPAGWTVEEVQGMKYKMAFSEKVNGFSSYANVVDEKFAGRLKEYFDASAKVIEKYFKNYQMIERLDFVTDKGLKVKIIRFTRDREDGVLLHLRQSQYFFDKGDTKYIVTFTCLAENGAALDKLFDQSMKTFEFVKAP